MTSDQKRDYIKARKNLIARNEEIMKKRRRIVSDLEVWCRRRATLTMP